MVANVPKVLDVKMTCPIFFHISEFNFITSSLKKGFSIWNMPGYPKLGIVFHD